VNIDMDRHAARAWRNGDFGANAIERPVGSLLRLSARHAEGAHSYVRIEGNGAGQLLHRNAGTLGTKQEDDVARTKVRALGAFAESPPLGNHVRFLEQLTPASVR